MKVSNNEEKFIYFRHHRGPRKYQEDAYGVSIKGNKLLVVVADGMGGHSKGDIASKIVVQSLNEVFNEYSSKFSAKQILKTGIQYAAKKIKETGVDMGSTVVAGVLEKGIGGKFSFTYTWIGDSRIYVFTPSLHRLDKAIPLPEELPEKERKLWLLTEDHSLVWQLYAQKLLSLDQLSQHPAKNQLQHSLHASQSDFSPPIRTVLLNESDIILLCTDGVWESFLSHSILFNIFENSNNLKEVATTLNGHLDNAIRDNLCDDNNTYILLKVNDALFKEDKVVNSYTQKYIRKKEKHQNKLIFVSLFLLLTLGAGLFLYLYSKTSTPTATVRVKDKILSHIIYLRNRENEYKISYGKTVTLRPDTYSIMFLKNLKVGELYLKDNDTVLIDTLIKSNIEKLTKKDLTGVKTLRYLRKELIFNIKDSVDLYSYYFYPVNTGQLYIDVNGTSRNVKVLDRDHLLKIINSLIEEQKSKRKPQSKNRERKKRTKNEKEIKKRKQKPDTRNDKKPSYREDKRKPQEDVERKAKNKVYQAGLCKISHTHGNAYDFEIKVINGLKFRAYYKMQVSGKIGPILVSDRMLSSATIYLKCDSLKRYYREGKPIVTIHCKTSECPDITIKALSRDIAVYLAKKGKNKREGIPIQKGKDKTFSKFQYLYVMFGRRTKP